jgi:hypothetical protein
MTGFTIAEDDLAHCRRLLAGGSKSFHAASMLLPRRIAAPATALYAFCRVADDEIDLSGGKQQAMARLAARLDWVLAGLVIIIAVFMAFLFWLRYGREFRPDFEGDYYRELPAEYSPAELGVLWRFGRPAPDDITATILDLARRGYLRLEEYVPQSGGIFGMGNELVYEGYKKHAAKKGNYRHPGTRCLTHLPGQGIQGFSENLYQRDIYHNSCRETQGHREEFGVGPFGIKGNCAAYPGGQAGKHGQPKC